MMEFYEAYADYQSLMAMTEELLETVARESIGTSEVTFGEHQISLKAPFARLSLREAAREAASRRLKREVTEAELREREPAAALARQLGLEVDAGRRRREDRDGDVRAAVRGPADSADLRL